MTQTPAFYFDILEILPRERCPACDLTRQKAMHYIDHALYGLVTDPTAQNLFADTGGYCRRHGEMLLKIPWGSALGVAILYNRLVEDAVQALKSGAGKKGGGLSLGFLSLRRKPSLAKDGNPDCLACDVERDTEQAVLHTLVESLRAEDGRMLAAVEGSEGFCLYHLDLALQTNSDDKVDVILRRHGLRKAEHLLAELKEFIRKSDYRFTKEPMGAEGDSWSRAVAWVTGVSLGGGEPGLPPGELKRRLREENR
jgi:hypothetical protein